MKLKQYKYIAIGSLSTFIAVLLLVGIVNVKQIVPKVFGDIIANPYFAIANNTNATCAPYNASSTALIGTSTSRNYIRLTNTGSSTVYLAEGIMATSSSGIPLTSSSTYVSDQINLYTGAFYCVAPSGSSTIAIMEQK